MKNKLFTYEWKVSELPGGCTPVVFGDDIALHDGKGDGLGELYDEVGYYETTLSRDFSLSCKLLESERAYYGVALSTGIMLRDGVNGDDAMIYFGLGPDGEYHIIRRASIGEPSVELPLERFSQTHFRFMKLSRTRGRILCAVSRHGENYETAADIEDSLPPTVHVGFTSAFKSVYGSVTLT